MWCYKYKQEICYWRGKRDSVTCTEVENLALTTMMEMPYINGKTG